MPGKKNYPRDVQDQVINMYLGEGDYADEPPLSVKRISDATGVPQSSVHNILRENEVKPNRRPAADEPLTERERELEQRLARKQRALRKAEAECKMLRAKVRELEEALLAASGSNQ